MNSDTSEDEKEPRENEDVFEKSNIMNITPIQEDKTDKLREMKQMGN